MQNIERQQVYHHPFHRLYDADGHLQGRRNVYLIGAAAIQFTTILAALFPETLLPLLAQGESRVAFIVEGYLFSLATLLLGLRLGDHAPSRNMEGLAFALSFAISFEIPIAIIVALQSL